MRSIERGAGAALALGLMTTTALAGGVERSTQQVSILFEEGNYAEFTLGYLDPKVSGNLTTPAFGPALVGSSSGDMLGSEVTGEFGIKTDLGDDFVLALVVDQPVGATIDYPTNTIYPYAGSTAELRSTAATAYLRYKIDNAWSVYGGLRGQQVKGNVALFTGYTLETNRDTEWGYSLGVGWERPEIAARVTLTYNSAIDHEFASTENAFVTVPGLGTIPVALDSSFTTTIPQSVNLDGQTGIAKDTLLFGSIRWVDWSEFTITPPLYTRGVGEPLVSYNNDTFTYVLGLGRRFNEQWSGAVTLTHEPSTGGFFGNLGPVDGRTGIGLGGTYRVGAADITAGVQYSWLGDAKTRIPGTTAELASFTDNTAVTAGIKVGFQF